MVRRVPSILFKILAMGPFRLHEKGRWLRGSIRVNKAQLDQVLEEIGPSLSVSVPKTLCPPGTLTLIFKRLKDFHPDGLLRTTPFLRNLLEARKLLEQAATKGLSSQEIRGRLEDWPDLPPLDLNIADQRPKTSSTGPVDRILEVVELPDRIPTPSHGAQPLTAQAESILQKILGHIFSNEDFRSLESCWRGLQLLMKQGGVDGAIKVEIVPISHESLEETLPELLPEMIQDPPSLVIIDLPFDNSPRSLELLEKIAQFSETLLAPAISWITPRFLFLDTWKDLKRLPYLPHHLEESVFAKWRRYLETSSAGWMAVGCNRFLLRYPYGPDNKTTLVGFKESEGLWASPVWALGCLISQSFARTGWPTRFTEWQKTRVQDLPLHAVGAHKSLPTEASFSEERLSQFVKVGIIPLVGAYDKDIVFTPVEATVAAGSLSYQLFVNRITQFLFWCKDNLGPDLEPADIERGLREAFNLWWESTGHRVPEGLEISVTKPDPEKPTQVSIVIEPSREILPSREKVELSFNW